MNTSILILSIIAILELVLIGIFKKQLEDFRKNYSMAVLKICDMFIEVASRIEELDREIKKVEKELDKKVDKIYINKES